MACAFHSSPPLGPPRRAPLCAPLRAMCNSARSTLRACLPASVLVLIACVLSACWSYKPAPALHITSPAVSTLPADAWPARNNSLLQPLLKGSASQEPAYLSESYTFWAPKVRGAKSIALSEGAKQLGDLPVHVREEVFLGQGLVRVFDVGDTPAQQEKYREVMEEAIGFLPTGTFVTSRVMDDPNIRGQLEARRRIREGVRDVLNELAAKGLPLRANLHDAMEGLHLGVAFRLPPASAIDKGLVIHLHSIAPNPFENRVVKGLEASGWRVVTINTSTGVRPAYTPEQEADIARINRCRADAILGWTREFVSAFESSLAAQSPTVQAPPSPDALLNTLEEELRDIAKHAHDTVANEEDAQRVGVRIAREVDDGLASNAYAVESILAYIRQKRPDLDAWAQGKPVVLMGFSAGAIAAPTVAVRSLDAFDAVVLLGGGVNIFDISQRSTLTDGGIKLRMGERRPPEALVRTAGEAYLSRSKLDPYHTAPLLAGVPILQVHAAWDEWVPASTGELLHERLPASELWTLRGGHMALFAMLPGQTQRIVQWMDEHAKPRATRHNTQNQRELQESNQITTP